MLDRFVLFIVLCAALIFLSININMQATITAPITASAIVIFAVSIAAYFLFFRFISKAVVYGIWTSNFGLIVTSFVIEYPESLWPSTVLFILLGSWIITDFSLLDQPRAKR
ncbi:hypothetical protein B0H94_102279 [Salsuginibacillus halophilus]|uniref:Uncharacterized protein n=1 Tax=Salsuginibacillus halophilus TaxID=517424 RepID=A0A2P8HXP6_9BACI|nr:hypothetical protein [Salsuginibacillus halophilus]PSL51002.1 hypothetical protein B0H94_102279 [Salsuginibacillus halophilus]